VNEFVSIHVAADEGDEKASGVATLFCHVHPGTR